MKRLFSSAVLVAALLPLSAFAGTYTFSQSGAPFTNSSGISHGTAVTWGLGSTADGTNYTSLFNDIKTSGKVVTGATLTLTNVYDWTNETNDPADALYINILSGLDTGVKTKVFDAAAASRLQDLTFPTQASPFSASSSAWNSTLHASTALKFNDAGANSLLKANPADTKGGTPAAVTWSDPKGGAARGFNLVLNFSADNLSAFTSLLAADTSIVAPNVGIGFAAECHYFMSGVTLSVTTGPASVPDTGSTLALMGLGLGVLVSFRRFKK